MSMIDAVKRLFKSINDFLSTETVPFLSQDSQYYVLSSLRSGPWYCQLKNGNSLDEPQLISSLSDRDLQQQMLEAIEQFRDMRLQLLADSELQKTVP